MKKLWIGILVLVVVLPMAWYLLSPLFKVIEANEPTPLSNFEEAMKEMEGVVVEENEAMPEEQSMMLQGDFVAKAHEVEGKVLLLEVDRGKVLRFENFNTVNGPDLRIYLSKDLTDDDFVELGKIKATKGNVNYDIPESVDINEYNNVLVWCKPFGVLFSSATLE